MIDLEAIRERDADSDPCWHEPGTLLERMAQTHRDRRALLQYVDELRKAAGKVTCRVCQGTGHDRGWPVHNPPCYACADLRRLQGESRE